MYFKFDKKMSNKTIKDLDISYSAFQINFDNNFSLIDKKWEYIDMLIEKLSDNKNYWWGINTNWFSITDISEKIYKIELTPSKLYIEFKLWQIKSINDSKNQVLSFLEVTNDIIDTIESYSWKNTFYSKFDIPFVLSNTFWREDTRTNNEWTVKEPIEILTSFGSSYINEWHLYTTQIRLDANTNSIFIDLDVLNKSPKEWDDIQDFFKKYEAELSHLEEKYIMKILQYSYLKY